MIWLISTAPPMFQIQLLTYRYIFFAASSFCLIMLATGCSDTRIFQCNQLIQVANKAKSLSPALEPLSQNRAADQLDALRDQIRDLPLDNEKVKGFQARLIEHLKEGSQILREASKAATDKNLIATEKIKQPARAFAAKEEPLLDEINGFCSL
jgi:TolA-binding protein